MDSLAKLLNSAFISHMCAVREVVDRNCIGAYT